MGRKRNIGVKWVFLFLLPFIIVLFSHSSVYGQWSSVSPPAVSPDWYISAVHFTSATEGWAVGEDYANSRGALLHYQNGTWTSVAPPAVSARWYISAVHFTSATEGWAVGWDGENSRGALLHYQNGTWTSVAPPAVSPDWDIWAVHFTSATEGWAAGYDVENSRGVLLHYRAFWPIEGTIGTELTITGSGFGTKKGKVLIGGVATKIATDGWKSDSITCTVTKIPPAGIHDVTIKPNKAADIPLSNAFTVKPPEIDSLDVYHGVAGITPITITGIFFSTKKGKVYLEIPGGKTKNCKVTSWGMDSITFVVPKTSNSFPSGTYPLKITNKVGTAYAPSDFTVD